MKNIHVLSTDKPSRIIKSQDNDFILLNTNVPNWFEINLNTTKQNTYITNDEEIKEGDWYLSFLRDKFEVINYLPNGGYRKECLGKEVCKIILTTDQDLIEEGVQAIDDEFLEWFVKNPSCEEVNVKNPLIANVSDFGYKIIIPKEETNGCIGSNGFSDPKLNEVQLNQSKKETLEEIIGRQFQFNSSTVIKDEKYVYLMDKHSFNIAVDNILKWQQEQGNNKFSEEDMIRFANLYSDIDINESHLKYFNNLPKFKNK